MVVARVGNSTSFCVNISYIQWYLLLVLVREQKIDRKPWQQQQQQQAAAAATAACTTTTLVWFRRDLRLEDNPALLAAARLGIVIPVFVWCPQEEGHFQPGRVSRWWLKQSLRHLSSSLATQGGLLLFKQATDTLEALLQIAQATGATQVFYNHLYDPISLVRDDRVKQGLLRQGLVVRTFKGDLLYEPWEIHDKEGQAFTTFASFWQSCLSMPSEPDPPLLPPRQLVPFSGADLSGCGTCALEELGLENETEKSSNALLSRTWSPGWPSADRALEKFITGPLRDYATNRRKADSATTSLLSPHLHFGEISVRKMFHVVRLQQIRWVRDEESFAEKSVDSFLRSLGFREYSRYLCFNFPFTHERTLLANLKHYPWRKDEGYFKAWRQGRTGYPLVDAGMRELWATGWLHCRIRVVVSSFFVKFLQLPWKWGMKYFWDTLLDADLENDVLGWQYISGSLPDGHELDRLEDPQVQGYKLDPRGEYIRKWLPELSRVPTEWIHHPWDAPSSVLRASGVELGSNYPRPIVEIAAARERQQQALAEMWSKDAAMKANGRVEAGTVQVVSTPGGPQHQKMDVHTTLVKAPCKDQMVPNYQKQSMQGAFPFGPAAAAAEAAPSAATVEVVKNVTSFVPVASNDFVLSKRKQQPQEEPQRSQESTSAHLSRIHLEEIRVPEIRCGVVFSRKHSKVDEDGKRRGLKR